MREGWESCDLEKYIKLIDYRGRTPKKTESGVKLITAKNVKLGYLQNHPEEFIAKDNYEEWMRRGIPEYGDVIFTTEAPLGNVAQLLTKEKVAFAQRTIVMQPNIEVLNKTYLKYLLLSPEIRKDIFSNGTGATVTGIKSKLLKKIQIPIPPLPEQKQIVALLDEAFTAIDQAKANIERNIVNAKELFDSKKEELFEKLADKFSPKPLIEACEKIFAGGDAPKDNFSKEKTKELNVPIIANAVKRNGLYGYTNEARVTKPSITVAARGSGTGHTEFRDYPFFPIVRLIVLTPDTNKINVEFLMHAIKNLTIKRSGSAIPQLTVPMIKSYSVPIPNLDRQHKIVESLNNIESQLIIYKSKLNQKLIDLDDLKKSLLQKAFAGELTSPEGTLSDKDGSIPSD